MGSFRYSTNRISAWKSAGILKYSDNSNMNAVGNTSGNLPDLKNDGRMHVYLSGNYFKQDRARIPMRLQIRSNSFICFIWTKCFIWSYANY